MCIVGAPYSTAWSLPRVREVGWELGAIKRQNTQCGEVHAYSAARRTLLIDWKGYPLRPSHTGTLTAPASLAPSLPALPRRCCTTLWARQGSWTLSSSASAPSPATRRAMCHACVVHAHAHAVGSSRLRWLGGAAADAALHGWQLATCLLTWPPASSCALTPLRPSCGGWTRLQRWSASCTWR